MKRIVSGETEEATQKEQASIAAARVSFVALRIP